jgi:hypothetical protein
MEALIFMFDVACMTYLCWRVYKIDPKHPKPDDLGYFQYRVHDVHAQAEPPPGKADGRRQERTGA